MITWYDRLPSTMNAAHDQAAAGAPHGSAVAAREQTQGRGRRGRAWTAPRGGLWLSVICRPPAGLVVECLGPRIGLAVADAIARACPRVPPIGLKWPNDLYLHDRKLGGVLCEARWDGERLAWVVAGIGLNVRNVVPGDLQGLAISLREFDDRLTPEILAEAVATSAARAAEVPGPLTDQELAAYRRRDWLRGRRLVAPASGVAAGIAPDGALLIEAGGRVRKVSVSDSVQLG